MVKFFPSPVQLLNVVTILRQTVLVEGRTWMAMPEFCIRNFLQADFFGLTLRSDIQLIYVEMTFHGPN